MIITENYALKQYNSFHFDVKSKFFAQLTSETDIYNFFATPPPLPFLILGAGNNILFTKDFDGYVLKMDIKAIDIVNEDDDYVFIKAMAGENWDDFVAYCTKKNYGGLENLSLIPGQVGSSPIQNIGAYGAEVKDTIVEVHTINIKELKPEIFNNVACCFAYRESIFKTKFKQSHIITAVVFKLSKKPQNNLSYAGLKTALAQRQITNPSIADIRTVVCDVRNSKLPSPDVAGNAGSFFKNPVVDKNHFASIKKTHPDVVSFPAEDGNYKLAAGWLIEACGWKGYCKGDAGVHPKQALVLVNYGNATGIDILSLAKNIQNSVLQQFNVKLELEVNVV